MIYKYQSGGRMSLHTQITALLVKNKNLDKNTASQAAKLFILGCGGEQLAMQYIQSILDLGGDEASVSDEIMSFLEQGILQAEKGAKMEYIHRLKSGKKATRETVSSSWKSKCPCELKRVGGKIIEVDCYGIPVAKKGRKIVKAQVGLGYGLKKRYLKEADANPDTENPHYWYDTSTNKWMMLTRQGGVWGDSKEVEEYTPDDYMYNNGYNPETDTFDTIQNAKYSGYTYSPNKTKTNSFGIEYNYDPNIEEALDTLYGSDQYSGDSPKENATLNPNINFGSFTPKELKKNKKIAMRTTKRFYKAAARTAYPNSYRDRKKYLNDLGVGVIHPDVNTAMGKLNDVWNTTITNATNALQKYNIELANKIKDAAISEAMQ